MLQVNLIGNQPVSGFSTTRGGSMRKRGTTKPVEDEESAPVSTLNTAKLPKLFSRSHQPVSLLFISSSHFPNVFARPIGKKDPLSELLNNPTVR